MHILSLTYVFSECQLADLVGDGYCHDWTNNRHCNFDGGDCCGPCVNREKCSECVCKGGGVSTNAWIGDGFCHDLTNNKECETVKRSTDNTTFYNNGNNNTIQNTDNLFKCKICHKPEQVSRLLYHASHDHNIHDISEATKECINSNKIVTDV